MLSALSTHTKKTVSRNMFVGVVSIKLDRKV